MPLSSSSRSSDPGAHVLSPASGTRLRRSVPEAELAADRAGEEVEPEADGTGTQMIEADGVGACFVGVGCAADCTTGCGVLSPSAIVVCTGPRASCCKGASSSASETMGEAGTDMDAVSASSIQAALVCIRGTAASVIGPAFVATTAVSWARGVLLPDCAATAPGPGDATVSTFDAEVTSKADSGPIDSSSSSRAAGGSDNTSSSSAIASGSASTCATLNAWAARCWRAALAGSRRCAVPAHTSQSGWPAAKHVAARGSSNLPSAQLRHALPSTNFSMPGAGPRLTGSHSSAVPPCLSRPARPNA